MDYDWPGNIRELENVIERAIILSKEQVINPEDFPESVDDLRKDTKLINNDRNLKLKEALKSPEKDLIVKALESANYSRNEAAKALGINRTTLYKKMQKFGLLKNNGNGK